MYSENTYRHHRRYTGVSLHALGRRVRDVNTDHHGVALVEKVQLLCKKLVYSSTFQIELERNVRPILCAFFEILCENTDRMDPKFDVCQVFHEGISGCTAFWQNHQDHLYSCFGHDIENLSNGGVVCIVVVVGEGSFEATRIQGAFASESILLQSLLECVDVSARRTRTTQS